MPPAPRETLHLRLSPAYRDTLEDNRNLVVMDHTPVPGFLEGCHKMRPHGQSYQLEADRKSGLCAAIKF